MKWLAMFCILASLPGAAAAPSAARDRDISYAHDAGPDQRMDLFWPESNPSATVLFIHGGSLQEAERFMPPVLEQGSRFVRRLLEEGVSADLVVVPGKHMSSIASLGDANDPAFRAIRAFIEDPRRAAPRP
jgi:acetyl esterase/lipase